MTLDDLQKLLEGLQPGHFVTISYELYSELFPPGGASSEAREACCIFAKSVGATIAIEAGTHVKFVKSRVTSKLRTGQILFPS